MPVKQHYTRLDTTDFYTVKDAARVLDVEYQRLYKLIRDGQVVSPTHQIGMKNYYAFDDLKTVRTQVFEARKKLTE